MLFSLKKHVGHSVSVFQQAYYLLGLELPQFDAPGVNFHLQVFPKFLDHFWLR